MKQEGRAGGGGGEEGSGLGRGRQWDGNTGKNTRRNMGTTDLMAHMKILIDRNKSKQMKTKPKE